MRHLFIYVFMYLIPFSSRAERGRRARGQWVKKIVPRNELHGCAFRAVPRTAVHARRWRTTMPPMIEMKKHLS